MVVDWCVVVEICSASLGAVAASAIRVPQERIKQPVQADLYSNWIEACKVRLMLKLFPLKFDDRGTGTRRGSQPSSSAPRWISIF